MKRIFASILLSATLLGTLPNSADACLDLVTSCAVFRPFCNDSKELRDSCPFTCNVCPQDPCPVTNGGCNHKCSWSDPVVTCSCFPGFRLEKDGKTCVDIDECTEGPDPCTDSLAKFCVNTDGSYSCQTYDCATFETGKINRYKSDQCCQLRNGSCGMNLSIRSGLENFISNSSGRIFGGTAASLASWPWMGQITTAEGHRCGAVLLTRSWVVTASDCVVDLQSGDITVTLGHVRNAVFRFLETSRAQRRGVAEIIQHPSFVLGGVEQNNIALLRLSSPVNFTDVVSPICLPCGEIPSENDTCWTAGFGLIEENSQANVPRVLQEVDVPIVPIKDCIQSFQSTPSGFTVNRQTMMCAGYAQGKKDACMGDSGGPLMCQRRDSCEWYLAGIIGGGLGCGRKGFYGIFTNVFRFEKWIRNAIGDDAEQLCSADYNPCTGLEDEMLGCSSLSNACDGSNRSKCALTCCLRDNGREPNCFDHPEATEICPILKEQCDNTGLQSFLMSNCPRTCAFC